MTSAEKKYGNIISMDRPQSKEILRKYPPQPMSERAKIFSPFAALRGHGERLSEEDDRLLLVERAELNEEDQKALSEKLADLKKGDAVTLTYFEPAKETQGLGRYETISGTLLEVDPALKRLRLHKEEPEKEGSLILSFSDLYALYFGEPSEGGDEV